MSAPDQLSDCLTGGGEMGALMRAVDWSATALGPAEGWPQSLRTAVSILLATRFPMYIGWGPGYVQFYNDGYRPILGSTKHPAAMGLGARETFPESWHIIGPMFDGVMRGEAFGTDDWMLPLDRYGYLEECYFTFSYSPIRDESGGVGGVLVTVTETTDRVLGERRLRTLQALATHASEAKDVDAAWTGAAGALVDSPHDLPFALFYAVEEGGRWARLVGASGIERGTPAAPEKVDLSREEPGCWPLSRAASGRPEPVADLHARFGDLPGGAWPESPREALILPVARPGLEHPYGFLIAGISARRALDGAYRSFLEMVAGHAATGVSNARAYEEERRRAAALAELDRAKTAFFSNVSHEFRTPLTLILGSLEELRSAGPSNGRAELVEAAHRNGLRLLKLVNTLLDFSRIEAGRIQALYEPTELDVLTAEFASVFRSAVERAGLRLRVECAPLPEPVYVDRAMWEKIVLNLLSNAFKFTFEGEIAVSLRLRDRSVELRVQDTGIGIGAEELRHLFDRFYRVQGARGRTHEGTGIGLSLVRELVALHGGEIGVTSTPAEGSAFTVTLPLGHAHLPEERIGTTPGPATAVNGSLYVEEALRWLPYPSPGDGAAYGGDALLQGPDVSAGQARTEPILADAGAARILLADDNADMRAYLARLLRPRYEVEAVPDGAAALEEARRRKPDLVLADVMMPQMDGFQLLRALRADPGTRTLPVLLLSARAGEEARVEGLEAGATDYLVKPFSARELLARIAAQLELARLRREMERHEQDAHAFAESERRRLFALFEQAPVAICVLRGPDHVFELANPLYQKLLPGRALLGRPLREAMPEIEAEGLPFLDLLDRVYAEGRPYGGTALPVSYDRDGDGQPEEVFFTFLYQPLTGPGGAVQGVLAVAIDVTEQIRNQQHLERLTTELERSNRELERFAYIASHDLREPLRMIAQYSQMLKRRYTGRLDADADEMFHFVVDGARRLDQLIRDLLSLSRVGVGELKRERVELRRVVDQALNGLDLTIRETGARIVCDELPEMEGNPTQLLQLFQNLIGNALKFRHPARPPEVRISARREAGEWWLSVSDNGIGIDPRYREQVFEPFRRLHTRDEYEGSGIGLATCKKIVERHGGKIWIESDLGSVFHFTLPAA